MNDRRRRLRCGGLLRLFDCFLLKLFDAAAAMDLLPNHSADISNTESGDAGEDSRCDHHGEEIPETANECAACELIRQESPGERRGTNESREESNVCSKVFYRRSTEVVELGENRRRPLEMVLNLLRA